MNVVKATLLFSKCSWSGAIFYQEWGTRMLLEKMNKKSKKIKMGGGQREQSLFIIFLGAVGSSAN